MEATHEKKMTANIVLYVFLNIWDMTEATPASISAEVPVLA